MLKSTRSAAAHLILVVTEETQGTVRWVDPNSKTGFREDARENDRPASRGAFAKTISTQVKEKAIALLFFH
jgi:hypothetical protein